MAAGHRLLAAAVAVAMSAGCGVTPNQQIADEFHERLQPPSRGWRSIPCPDRAAKLEALHDLYALAIDVRSHARDFDTPLPPQLHADLLNTPLLGLGSTFRCVVQDLHGTDLSTEPNLAELTIYVANLLMLKARARLEQGDRDDGWAHVLETLALYAAPLGADVPHHFGVPLVLGDIEALALEHPPPPSLRAALVDATQATVVPTHVRCAALRHELLETGVASFRGHFDRREKTAVAQRFGLDRAMRDWRQHAAGQQGWGVWEAFRETYDAVVTACTTVPLGTTMIAGAPPSKRLDLLHPETGMRVRMVTQRLNTAGEIIDARISLLALLRAMALRESLGREPTTAELALSFGRRPRSAWDGRPYTFALDQRVLTVTRGSYSHEIRLPPPG
ncbi:MAG: hypothetical protein AAF799_02125 [Myxococcota bacterium]